MMDGENLPGSPTSPETPQAQASKPWSARWIVDNFLSLGLALLIVFTIRSSLVEAFKIPSGSMIPTLLVGDHIFVNKLAYGLKVPFSDWITGKPVYVVDRAPPQRGDIIVFVYPKDESLYYIKRVVAVPGDTIEIRDKQLYVNAKPVPRMPLIGPDAEKIFSSLDDPRYARGSLDLFKEQMEKDEHVIMLDKNSYLEENRPAETIPPRSLFVMGDNRDFSNDSRFWGYVPYDNVKGKAMFIWLSLWLNFSDSQFTFRPERIGTILHHSPSTEMASATSQPTSKPVESTAQAAPKPVGKTIGAPRRNRSQ